MKYFTENATGEVYGYDSKTQNNLINRVDLTSFSVINKLPTDEEAWDKVARTWKPDATKVAEKKHRDIVREYETKRNAGVKYKGAIFQSDRQSMAALVAVVTALANGWIIPDGYTWVDKDNKEHPADAAWLKGLLNAFADHKASLFARKTHAKKLLER